MKRIVALILFFTVNVFAQTVEEATLLVENESGFGVKAAALGNAFTAIADDYSAIYWNPAGLAQIKMQQMYGSLNHLKLNTETTFLGNKTTLDQGYTKFQSFGYVYPFPVRRGSMVLALGYQRTKDLNKIVQFSGFNPNSNDLAFSIYNDLGYDGLILPFDADLNLSQNIKEDGHLSQWSIGGAIDLAPNFSAGATVNFIGGSSDYRLKYLQEDARGTNSYDIYDADGQLIENFYYNYYQIEQLISTDYSGIELKLGGLWRLNQNLRVGANITFPMKLSVDETWTYADELSYDVYVIGEDATYRFVEPYDSLGQFNYNIKVPFKFDLGFSYTFKNLLLAASGRYVDWTQLELEKGDDAPAGYETYFTRQNDMAPLILTDVFSYSLGAQLSILNNSLQLRAGYRYVPSPIKDSEKSFDKTYVSVGAGFIISKNTQIDVAVIRGIYETDKYYRYDWDYDQSLEPMATHEKYQIDRIQVGLRYSF
ncbi:membrane protein involved in aromatic hydrocarbon degradation [Caldithrix abyssi DSM 13497]|uniref:Long-chain fatty acid transport protein n=1 Tax=Caldithrix abyssi DSM 13497 TaxID=880073 RepID=H1XWB7_CALAY|nr:outer membrane protein transport protein [Caldithrix abyssi]APF20821.1 Long-chain fatty acid transport protein [Caldithrix abyssi DSM 13497]EHO40699.1 membrane protein involved in aromatic hydrocarbon degradation [Caldithrix abyssi DSM 13497]